MSQYVSVFYLLCCESFSVNIAAFSWPLFVTCPKEGKLIAFISFKTFTIEKKKDFMRNKEGRPYVKIIFIVLNFLLTVPDKKKKIGVLNVTDGVLSVGSTTIQCTVYE